MKKIIFSLLIATSLFSTGCLKDKDYENQKYGILNTEVKGVGFVNDIYSAAILADATPQVISVVNVGLSANNLPANDVKYTVASTPSVIPTTLGATVLPANAFTFNASPVVPKGSYFGNFPITITNASLLDPNKTYAVGFTITGAESGVTVAENARTFYLTFNIKNKYDGVYAVTGTFLDASNATFTGRYPLEFELVTTGPSSVDVQLNINGVLQPGYLFNANGAGSFFGSFGLSITFNPATDVISDLYNYYGDPTKAATSVGNPALGSGAPLYNALPQGRRATLDPSGINAYDFTPATRGIKIKYFMLQPSVVAGGPRCFFNETWKYVGPRD